MINIFGKLTAVLAILYGLYTNDTKLILAGGIGVLLCEMESILDLLRLRLK